MSFRHNPAVNLHGVNPSLGTLLILVTDAATYPAAAFHQPATPDRDTTLAGDHDPTRGGYNTLNCGTRSVQLPAWPSIGRRQCGFPLGGDAGGPSGFIHSVERHKTPTRVTYTYAYLDVERLRLCYSRTNDLVCLC